MPLLPGSRGDAGREAGRCANPFGPFLHSPRVAEGDAGSDEIRLAAAGAVPGRPDDDPFDVIATEIPPNVGPTVFDWCPIDGEGEALHEQREAPGLHPEETSLTGGDVRGLHRFPGAHDRRAIARGQQVVQGVVLEVSLE